MRIAIVGDGRMGRAVADVAVLRGHAIVATFGGEEARAGQALSRERLSGADVAVEFTRAEAASGTVRALLAAGIPVVSGTTGWGEELARVRGEALATGGSLLHAPNFSVGVALIRRAATVLAGAASRQPGFEAFVIDEHHAGKRDAPSGTALLLQETLRAADPARTYPITSIRAGHHPGRHRVTWDARFESIHLEHAARDRRVFAEGAVIAAEWLVAHPGVHTFEDMLFGRNP